MNNPRITTQKQLRAEFWRDHPKLSRRKITNYRGDGKMYTTDTRSAFVDYVDMLSRNGDISQELAERVTL